MRTYTIWRNSVPLHPDDDMLYQRALELRKRHYPTFVKKAMKQGCSRMEAQQVVELCLAALAKREARPNMPAIDNEAAWLNGAVSNAVKKRLRKRARRHERDFLNDAVQSGVDIEAASRMQETLDAIRSMPHRQQCVLMLAGKGAELAEIAVELNCSEQTAERLLDRARRNLRRRLGE